MNIGSQPLLLSGGADGADLQFGMVAGTAGHQVIHFSFAGHRTKAPENEVVVLTQEMLEQADQSLVRANGTLRRRFPSGRHNVDNLLRRNYWQQRDAQALYAVGEIDGHGLLLGGTAWATQMFIDRHHGQECPIYVFDQRANTWMAHRGGRVWESVSSVPQPEGVYAGIGTRDLQANGKAAIRQLLRYSPDADQVRFDLVS